MKVLILGASGIVGQHMRLCVPIGVEPVWVRRTPDPITLGCDIEGIKATVALLSEVNPDVIVNLAGESSVDTVERDPARYVEINVGLPARLADWCAMRNTRLIQISSQAVFRGDKAPYSPLDERGPVNEYGRQKVRAEDHVIARGGEVIRLTFILGIRPLPHVGRQNPLEAILFAEKPNPQVNDRWFSPLMAADAAKIIWAEVAQLSGWQIIHVGSGRYSRYDVAWAAMLLRSPGIPCKSSDFPGIAPRPVDTSYAGTGSAAGRSLDLKIMDAFGTAKDDRSIELALFFGIRLEQAQRKLAQGFGPLHNAVSDDWRAKNPQTEAEMLDFYRTTEAYIWELSAYHEDVGFFTAGASRGVFDGIQFAGVEGRPGRPVSTDVLCLGDGIGELSIRLANWVTDDGRFIRPVFFFLEGSRTRQFAEYRFWRRGLAIPSFSGKSFTPEIPPESFDCIAALDFLEHVPNVEEWARAIHAGLRPGGLFAVRNAFSAHAIEMHLRCNYHWEQDWPELMGRVGFVDPIGNGWWVKA